MKASQTMQSTVGSARWVPMDDETRGAALIRRRLRLGIKSPQALDDAATRFGMPIDRKTIWKAERNDPSVSEGSYIRIESLLEKIEYETGVDEDEAAVEPSGGDMVEFTLTIEALGLKAAVKGPVADMAALKEQLAALVREIRAAGPD